MARKDKRLGVDPLEKRNKLAWLDTTDKQNTSITEKQKEVVKDKVTFYVEREKMQAFKILSIQQHKRFSDLITEAMDDIIKKYQ